MTKEKAFSNALTVNQWEYSHPRLGSGYEQETSHVNGFSSLTALSSLSFLKSFNK